MDIIPILAVILGVIASGIKLSTNDRMDAIWPLVAALWAYYYIIKV